MIDLSERQKVWAAAAVTSLAVAVVVSFALGLGWVALKALHLAAPALVPVILGLFLAMLFKPYYAWILGRLRNPTISVMAMALSVLVPAGLVVWYAGSMLLEQAVAFAASAPTVVARASAWAQANHPGLYEGLVKVGAPDSALLFFTDPAKFSGELFSMLGEQYGGQAVEMSFGVVRWLFGVISWILAAIFFVHFLMKPEVRGEDCVRQMPFLKERTRSLVAEQINAFIDIVVSFFRRQSVICLVEGCLYGLGFVFVGLPYGFLVGFALGVVNLVPLLGTVVFLPVALLLAFFGDGGSALRLVGVSCVWAAGQIADGYAITPLIQGKSTGLGFAGVIFSFMLWGAAFRSLLGLLLAIPLSAFCLVLWRTVREHWRRGVI